MKEGVSIPIHAATLTYTNSQGTEESYELQAPNAKSDALKWGFKKRQIQPDYYDSTQELRKGYSLVYFNAEFNYDWHRMVIADLIDATNIKVKVPAQFTEDESGYIEFDAICTNEEVLRDFLRSPAGTITGRRQRFAEQPYGSLNLQFKGRKPYTTYEIKEQVLGTWRHSAYVYTDQGTFITGYRRTDGDGFIELAAVDQNTWNYSTETLSVNGVNYPIKTAQPVYN